MKYLIAFLLLLTFANVASAQLLPGRDIVRKSRFRVSGTAADLFAANIGRHDGGSGPIVIAYPPQQFSGGGFGGGMYPQQQPYQQFLPQQQQFAYPQYQANMYQQQYFNYYQQPYYGW